MSQSGNKYLIDHVHLVPPVIREGSSLIIAHVNQDTVLPCEVEGGPSSSVLWRKDGGPVPLHNGRQVCEQQHLILAFIYWFSKCHQLNSISACTQIHLAVRGLFAYCDSAAVRRWALLLQCI